MGGTCVIRGCVPKKLMVFASRYRDQIEDARGYGWEVSGEKFHWPVMRDRLQNGLDQLEAVYRDMLDKSGVTHLQCPRPACRRAYGRAFDR